LPTLPLALKEITTCQRRSDLPKVFWTLEKCNRQQTDSDYKYHQAVTDVKVEKRFEKVVYIRCRKQEKYDRNTELR
jgi:hypothetical protein